MSNTNRERNRGEAAKLEMTPMIDVVFQLLIFFIVTLVQDDILSKLDVSRPAHSDEPIPDIDMLKIEVGRTAWTVNGRPYVGARGLAALDRSLSTIASYSRNTSVIVKCTEDSPHSSLIKVLDVCEREGFKNISVFSY